MARRRTTHLRASISSIQSQRSEMEDIKREYDGEPSRLTQIHESKPPKRPEKIAIDSASRTMSEDPPKKSYSQAISTNNANNELRATSEAPGSPTTNRPEKPDKARAAENQTLWRQMEDLQKQLRDARSRAEGTERELLKQLREANNRADQAERAAEGLIRQLKARPSEMPASSDDSPESIKNLMAENKDLKAELDDARSHIFSLQPYRKDLTPEEVGQEFDDLVNNVTDWVTKLIEPILDDDDKIDEALAVAKKKPHEAMSLKHKLHSDADLAFGCMFPDTDIDILITIVMRFLQDRIFQKVLFETIPHAVEVLSYIESSMQTNVEPKRDLFALRTWRAETMNALICSPDYQRQKGIRIKELTVEAAAPFRIFKKDKEMSKLYYSCQEAIIKPAVALHEKLLTSTHHFYLDLNPYVVWNARQELEMSPDFFDNLSNLKCENILHNRKSFNVSKLDPVPTREQLRRELLNVVAVVPALYMRQIGKGDVIREPAVVRMQQVLVAWGPQEKRERFLAKGGRTMLYRLCYPPRERQERAQEGSVWSHLKGIPWA